MAIPLQKELRTPLLIELLAAGGEARPIDLADRVAAHFPLLTEEDRAIELKHGAKKYYNRVQWTRQELVQEGLLDSPQRGIWRLTPAGRAAAEKAMEEQGPSPASTPSTPSLASLIDTHQREIRDQLLDHLLGIDPIRFEHICGQLLRAMGFREVVVTVRSSDGGVDGHGKLRVGIVTVQAAFQCKRYARSSTIGRPAIDAFRGATQGLYDQAIFITTTSFSAPAREASIRPGTVPIIMVDGDAIVDLMIQHEIGVTSKPLQIPLVDDEFFASSPNDQ